jgi:hypothetical protein
MKGSLPMKKTFAIIATAAALILSACTTNATANTEMTEPSKPASGVQSSTPSAQAQISAPELPVEEDSPINENLPAENSQAEGSGPMAGLTLNEYDGLKISAAVLPRKAILPGSVIPVTVIISNEGDKTISYPQGSSSYEIPDALLVEFDGLQPIPSKDRLVFATSDFGVKQLNPGEKLTFVINVLAAEPFAEFDVKASELYNSEQLYIAELEWNDLQTRYPGLIGAKSGSYTGTVSFKYSVVSGNTALAMFSEPTGYAQTKITVGVNG